MNKLKIEEFIEEAIQHGYIDFDKFIHYKNYKICYMEYRYVALIDSINNTFDICMSEKLYKKVKNTISAWEAI